MSIIYGKWNLEGKPIEKEILDACASTLNYWRADCQDTWLKETIGLGHLMLYNTPESLTEKLPYYDSLSKITITADARIDNRADLFQQLNIPHAFREGMPDSQLILKAYQKWGEHCPKYLYGAFAFAIWDEGANQLFCARDQIGIRPFYYHHQTGVFAFSTEIKGLLAIPTISKTVDSTYLLSLLTGIGDFNDHTFYNQIKLLLPAHSLMVTSDGLKIKKYWTLNPKAKIKLASDDEYNEMYKSLLDEAVTCRLRTNYPIASHLSGGLDSSGIAALAHQKLKDNNELLYTYSNAFPDDKDWSGVYGYQDEYDKVLDVLKFTGIEHNHKMTKSHLSYLEEVGVFLKANAHPRRSSVFLNTYRIAHQAANMGVRTMLTGFTGDEVATTNASGFLQYYFENLQWLKLWKALSYRKGNSIKNFYYIARSVFNHKFKRFKKAPTSLVTDKFQSFIGNKRFFELIEINFKEQLKNQSYKTSFSNQLLINRIQSRFIDERLELESLASIPYKIENRYPLADVRLIEFTLATPLEQKVAFGEGRWLFKRAMKGILPNNVIEQNKRYLKASTVPYEPIHQQSDYRKIQALLANTSNNDNIIDYKVVKRLLEDQIEMNTLKGHGKVFIGLQFLKYPQLLDNELF